MNLRCPTKPTIMVVDDEIANIEMIGTILEDDYEILFARSGEQAIAIAGTFTPDLILLDIVMPGLDGYETCRRLKRHPALADVPVIFTTGLDGVEHEVLGLSAGAIDYVIKPVQPDALRRRVGNHVEQKRMRDRLTSLAMLDPLTGLANRRMLEKRLDEMIVQLSPDSAWLAVILIDIDFFKQFNDLYGHVQGDECLAHVAAAIDGMIRRGNDLCARYGGEEFACLLPATDLAGARYIAEEMRKAVEGLGIAHAGSTVADRLTISLGVTSQRCNRMTDAAHCFESADALLYESKRHGRNRITAKEGER